MRTIALAISILGACKAEEQRSTTETKAPAPLAASSQDDLAKELDVADVHGTWAEVKRKWQGQTLRWSVTRHAQLCSSAERCNVRVFPIQRPAKHGWLPELVFAAGQFDALKQACTNREPCDVMIEGVLEKLEASAEMPTNVKLANVKVITRTASR